MIRILQGDSRDLLKELADASIHSVVCDPPYALVSISKRWSGEGPPPREGVYRRSTAGFMGKKWDTGETAFDPAFWVEVLRVMKPGAHLVAFGGTRTYHRLVCAIEDAGFEIRDQLAWVFGSGFPKSHDVSKGIDKAAGAEREVVGRKTGRAATPVQNLRGGNHAGGNGKNSAADCSAITAPATEAARQWQGWGTALKPAHEPIVLARKPLIGTVAANVLEHGTGALNIDACRVDARGRPNIESKSETSLHTFGNGLNGSRAVGTTDLGRWPANFIHDGSPEVLAGFPETNGQQGTLTGNEPTANGFSGAVAFGGMKARIGGCEPRGDSGSAARFFYTPKADKLDRLQSKHPTVKPVDLMAYLIKLVTPPGGTVLDPFAGSGSTGMAAMREGFDCILMEREAEYVADIKRRVAHVHGDDTPLFAEVNT